MSVFDDVPALLADAIASEGLGKTVTHVSVAPGVYDTATATATDVETETDVSALIEACRRELKAGVGVEASDLKLSVVATDFATPPKPGDAVEIDGARHAIVAANPVYGGSVVILYEIQARRG